MKVLVSGDWHIGVSHFGIIADDGRNSRLIDVEKSLHRAVDIAESQSIDLFVCAGDIFHTNKPSAEEQLVFFRLIQRMEQCKFKTRFIIGNHDHNSKLGASHALKLFMEIFDKSEKIKIYDKTTWELIPDSTQIEPLLVCFYPYHAEEPDFTQLSQFGSFHASALVCHSHLEGAVVGAEPFEIKSDKATQFKDLPVNHVWAGHFHKPQVLSYKPLAFYPGSIQAVDFNERFDVKGVVIVDTATEVYECAGIETRLLYQVDIDISGKGSGQKPEVSEYDLKQCKDAIVKINVKMDEHQSNDFDENSIRNQLVAANAHSIAGINIEIVRQELKRDPSIQLDVDLSDNFKRFVDGRQYGDHAERVKEIGINIIKQCSAS